MLIHFTEKEIKNIAKSLIQKAKEKKVSVVTLSGELGSGKTTLTKEVAKQLGVKEKIISPTFVIAKIYKTTDPKFKKLIHIDAYRLEKGEDLAKLGWPEWAQNEESLVILEWPEMVQSCILKEQILEVKLSHKDEETRVAEILL